MNILIKSPSGLFEHNDLINPDNIDTYIAADGYKALSKVLTETDPESVISVVEKSGLRGRGGGGFPTGKKWRSCRQIESDVKYVICNGDEGDPDAFKDRFIIERNPHSVIEGMIIGGYAVGASVGYLYVKNEPGLVDILEKAVIEAREHEFLGDNISGTDFSFDLRVNKSGGSFVSGESTALIAALEGYPGEPGAGYIHTSEKGLYGKPTIINNVETWVNIAPIILNGSSWFLSSGTKIFTLTGCVENTGIVEVPMGTNLWKLIQDSGSGILGNKKLKAVKCGGPSGGFISAELVDAKLDYEDLSDINAIIGSGTLKVIDEDTCIVKAAKDSIAFLKDELCGKCTPCREGIAQIYHILDGISKGEGEPADLDKLKDLAELLEDASLCALGKTAANPVLSTMKYFICMCCLC